MKSTGRLLLCMALVLISVEMTVLPSFAANSAQFRKARETLNAIRKLQKRLNILLANLEPVALIKLAAIPGTDSDQDGLPDLLENNYDRCDSDTDDDGVSDHDEELEEKIPDGGDSGEEPSYFNHHGIVVARTEANIKVGLLYFSLVGTKYVNDQYEPIPGSEITVGSCVLIKAEESGNVDLAVVVKKINSSECAQ